MTVAREMIARLIYMSNPRVGAIVSFKLRGGSSRKIEGLLLKGKAKDAGQEAKTTDVSCN